MAGEPRIEVEAVHPLSLAQEQLWALHQLDPGSSDLHLAVALRIRGPLDGELLENAVNRVRRRHAALRTIFGLENGEPVQLVLPHREIWLPRVDLTGTPEEERDGALTNLLRERARIPFHPEEIPPFRWLLVELGSDDHAFLHVAHRALFDERSTEIFFRELGICCEGGVNGDEPLLDELGTQYGDFARAQRERAASELATDQVDRWKARLDGFAGTLTTFRDRERSSPVLTGRGSTEWIPLPAGLSDEVRSMGAATFTVLLALFQGYLHRFSGRDDILVGIPVVSREGMELHDTIGNFVNALPIRVDLSEDPSFRDLLLQVRTRLREDLRNDAPQLDQLGDATRAGGRSRLEPLIQFFLRYRHEEEVPLLEIPRVQIDTLPIEGGGALGEFDLLVHDAVEGIAISVEYASELYEESTARRVLRQFAGFVEAAVRDPDIPISRLFVMTDEERERIEGWAHPAGAPFAPATVHQLVAEAADRWPEAPAIEGEGGTLTRRELEARSNRIARRLRRAGVRRGDAVGILLPRTPDLVAALLGIMKAGAGYLPLDGDHPAARSARILADAGAALLLTTGDLAASIARDPASRDLSLLLLDRESEAIEALSGDALSPGEWNGTGPASPDDPAYIIYTSGSTGNPKGVVVPHRAATNFLRAMARFPGVTVADRALAMTTLTFDISVMEIFLPLVAGGVVVLVGKEVSSDGRRMRRVLSEERITVMQATPSKWRLLLDSGWGGGREEGAPPLRVFCGGEALTGDLARALLERSPEVWNLYGPTETAVWCTRQQIIDPDATISIGRPIENVRAYVLDAHQQPVPEGVVGELWIGGAQVALGYAGQPELTAERFLRDPFSPEPGARMYRTGDLARWMADGSLQCFGRIDHQVKVRGHRIELGEVEAALLRLDEVRHAAAGVHGDGPGTERLVAWVAYHPGEELIASEVRRRLRAELPGYMVPSWIVEMEDLPRTPGGKIDRKALPAPFLENEGAGSDFVEPSTPAERTIAELWRDLLRVPRIGARDNFFELGGHSLLAMRALLLMEERTGHHFEPRDMVLGTLEQLAGAVSQGGAR